MIVLYDEELVPRFYCFISLRLYCSQPREHSRFMVDSTLSKDAISDWPYKLISLPAVTSIKWIYCDDCLRNTVPSKLHYTFSKPLLTTSRLGWIWLNYGQLTGHGNILLYVLCITQNILHTERNAHLVQSYATVHDVPTEGEAMHFVAYCHGLRKLITVLNEAVQSGNKSKGQSLIDALEAMLSVLNRLGSFLEMKDGGTGSYVSPALANWKCFSSIRGGWLTRRRRLVRLWWKHDSVQVLMPMKTLKPCLIKLITEKSSLLTSTRQASFLDSAYTG